MKISGMGKGKVKGKVPCSCRSTVYDHKGAKKKKKERAW